MADRINYAVDAIGLYFSIDSIKNNDFWSYPLPYTPQITNPKGNVIRDSVNWIQVSGEYIAKGGEKFITIGNFVYDSLMTIDTLRYEFSSNWSYYYIDDVSVIEDIGVGINEFSKDNTVSIFPNPSVGEITVETNINGEGKLEIIDVFGHKVREYSLNNGDSKLLISENQISSGVYLFKIITNQKVIKHEKVIVIR